MIQTKVTVQFSKINYISYLSRDTFICITFSSCSDWEPALSITWDDLPIKKYAMFYETDTCRIGGKYYHISDVGTEQGSHTFKTSQAIRSFMIGKDNDYSRRPSVIACSCCTAEERAILKETSTNVTIKLQNGSDGGLSSNWSDVLPAGSFFQEAARN
ncbi:hypothetical protein KRP22_005822 [Phytophthora ramorum]|uniref:uncharacterized protein n=1 Tax=Phytophthora ramorum TaxID=164328 RepID=UPI0030AEE87C|nr:hypothetical protein KRP23_3715 [Phytophthora ramorum]KAH7507952.1 hypothetical protein KRP22_3046 [Phytophthora ramorum]